MNKMAEFIRDLPYMKGQGYDTWAIYTQCRLETGNFEHVPAYNFAGMMNGGRGPDGKWYPDKTWKGKSQILSSGEYREVNGVDVLRPEESLFKMYDSPLDYFKDYDAMVKVKFPIAYPKRGDGKFYLGYLMTYDINGKIIWPSFCTAKGYEKHLVELYDVYNADTHYELKPTI